MSERPRGNTDKLKKPGTGNLRSAEQAAAEIYHHQRRTEALSKYAPMVVPLLKDVQLNMFGSTRGYGVDDHIESDEGARYGWRIFGMGAGEARFIDDTPEASQRKTLMAVELIFNEMASPIAFLVDTRRTHTVIKTGILGLRQQVKVTSGTARRTALNEDDLRDALNETAPTMDR